MQLSRDLILVINLQFLLEINGKIWITLGMISKVFHDALLGKYVFLAI